MRRTSLRLFYLLKPVVPRRLQMALRRHRARSILASLEGRTVSAGLRGLRPSTGRWPGGALAGVLLTHDVESSEGMGRIEAIRRLERKHGFVSTWNFVLEGYPGVEQKVKDLQAEGCECGAHGLYHDGRLFAGEKTFENRMRRIEELAQGLKMKGFRAPAMHRRKDLLSRTSFNWDSSYPSWDPFQPQPGGCGEYLPFWLSERTLELPVTLWQDFTLFSELGLGSWDIWRQQLDAVYGAGGLVNIIVHPDYVNEEILGMYREFLSYLNVIEDILVTTPSEIYGWYADRGIAR